jgi:hypothetical protein
MPEPHPEARIREVLLRARNEFAWVGAHAALYDLDVLVGRLERAHTALRLIADGAQHAPSIAKLGLDESGAR